MSSPKMKSNKLNPVQMLVDELPQFLLYVNCADDAVIARMLQSSVLWIFGKSRRVCFLEPFTECASTLKITVGYTRAHGQDHADNVM